MSITYNTSIVRSGLILHLDTSNIKSYNTVTSTSTWYDVSGIGNNGSLINSPTASDPNGLTLNGSTQYVNVPAVTSSMLSNGFTWAGWVKTSAYSSSWMWPFGSSAGNWLQLGKYSGNGYIRFDAATGLYSGAALDAPVNIADGKWHYIVGVWDTQYRYIYLDGVFQVSTASTPGASPGAYGNMYLGCHAGPGEFWNGQLGVMKIYNRGLSATEIQQNYQALRDRYGV